LQKLQNIEDEIFEMKLHGLITKIQQKNTQEESFDYDDLVTGKLFAPVLNKVWDKIKTVLLEVHRDTDRVEILKLFEKLTKMYLFSVDIFTPEEDTG